MARPTSDSPTPTPARLSIWTDVDPVHEPDFNRWYDREHMAERMAIPGFRRARRFATLDSCPRPYLALYDVDALAVFRSPAYARAIAAQTEWSQRNLLRMRDMQRRVGELPLDAGAGEGGALAAFVVAAAEPPAALVAAVAAGLARDGVLRVTLQQTDVGLSTPLAPGATPARADLLATVEATTPQAAADAAKALAAGLPDGIAGCVHVFGLLWSLGR